MQEIQYEELARGGCFFFLSSSATHLYKEASATLVSWGFMAVVTQGLHCVCWLLSSRSNRGLSQVPLSCIHQAISLFTFSHLTNAPNQSDLQLIFHILYSTVAECAPLHQIRMRRLCIYIYIYILHIYLDESFTLIWRGY